MQSGRKPLESAEEYAARRDEYLDKYRQARELVEVSRIAFDKCAENLFSEYGLDWDEAWNELDISLERISGKLEMFYKEVMDLEERR